MPDKLCIDCKHWRLNWYFRLGGHYEFSKCAVTTRINQQGAKYVTSPVSADAMAYCEFQRDPQRGNTMECGTRSFSLPEACGYTLVEWSEDDPGGYAFASFPEHGALEDNFPQLREILALHCPECGITASSVGVPASRSNPQSARDSSGAYR